MRIWPYIALPVATAALGTEELYRYVFCRDRGRLLPPLLDRKNHAPDYYIHRAAAEAEVRAAPQRRLTVRSVRGTELVGHYFPCGERPSGKIAFIVHGYRSNYAETAGIHFEYYRSRGFDVFACDHAAHGESGGRLIGYGSYESEDCLLWLQKLITDYGADVQIVLHGYSMGGATVLRTCDRVPENVKFIVEDSGFDCAAAVLKDSLGPMYVPLRLINRCAAGYDVERDTSVYQSLTYARVPILFVHGRADNMVPFALGQRLYEACPAEKQALFTEGVVHIETMLRAPKAYAAALDGFIERFM